MTPVDPGSGRNQAASRDASVGNPQGDGSQGGERQVPFFCPYCGDEELRPAGTQPGSWDCLACRRGFRLSFAGLVA